MLLNLNIAGINVLCGIGILTVPYTIHQGGWSSLLLLFLVSIIAGYTGVLLKRCLESSPGLKTYPDIGQAAFGVFGRLAIAVSSSSISVTAVFTYTKSY